MDWTFEKTKMLIDVVRQYPILYNGTPAYRKKEHVWRLVAQRIGFEGSSYHCKFKWMSLKKEFKQSLNSPTPFALAPYLSFLLPFMTAEKKDGDPLHCLTYLVKLTGLVREHPCLYNNQKSSPKAVIWRQIANNMNDGTTGLRCQIRWLKLRGKFANALKMGTSMSPKGIEEHLQFLKPFVRVHSLPPPQAVKTSEDLKFLCKLIDVVRGYPILYDMAQNSQDNFASTWQKVADTLGNGVTASECWCRWQKLHKNYEKHLKHQTQRLHQLGLVQRLSFLKPYVLLKRPAEEETITERERKTQLLAMFGRQCKALRIDVWDRDTIFLLNFLQDMANMDEMQVRRFRIGAVKAAREILEDEAAE